MSKKVTVLYDFQGETENELSIYVGEALTLLDETISDGWYYVKNAYGKEGCVPSTYVQLTQNETAPSNSYNNPYEINTNQKSYGGSNEPAPSYNTSNLFDFSFTQQPPSNTNSTYANIPSSTGSNTISYNKNPSMNENDSDFSDDEVVKPNNYEPQERFQQVRPGSTDPMSNISSVSTSSTGTMIPKSKNVLALDTYLLFGFTRPVTESEKTSSIILDEHGQPQWLQKTRPYKVTIPNISSGKKYQGLKQYTTYILSSNLGNNISRRYKQFDWLHERLMEKYPNLCIPALPGKAVTGRFEEEFIKKRQLQLEAWLNRMSMHPVVNQSELFVHFLQIKESDVSKWKDFKRKQEKEDFRGFQWLNTINVPQISVGGSAVIKDKIEKFYKASALMDVNVKGLIQGIEKLATIHASTYKKEVMFLGKKFEELGICISAEALSILNNNSNNTLSEALKITGATYSDIANQYSDQAKQDAFPLLDHLGLYHGILQELPDIIIYNKNAIQVFEELQQKPEKQDSQNIGNVLNRLNVINYSTLAEINYFNTQKINDFNTYMRSFLAEQIDFYSKITEKLKKAYEKYDAPINNFAS